MTLPDKWVRLAVYTAINNMTVNTETIPCYDTRATNYTGDFYVIMSTQTNEDMPTKCGRGWRHTILLDIFTRYRRNTGSREMADDIAQAVITALDGLALSGAAGIDVMNQRLTAPNDLVTETQNEIVHRKLLRYELIIN